MELTYKTITDADSFQTFRALLKASGLPADDLNYQKDLLVGYYEGNELVGTGALEIYGHYALLRSLSVKLGIRGRSVGTTITDYLIHEARTKNLKAIYLLTERAREFFLKMDFADTIRAAVPQELNASSEFTSVGSQSASVMYLNL